MASALLFHIAADSRDLVWDYDRMENIEIQGVTVVILGNFNPAIFSPDWLARQNVISPEEADEAKIGVIHSEITQFEVGDLAFDINVDRFSVQAQAEPFVRLADIIAEIFGSKLPHTPMRAVGINYHVHFRVRDHAQQNALGRKLAPLDAWGDWGPELESDVPGEVGGLTSLTMKQMKVPDRKAGSIGVTVQPSVQVNPGVYLQVNDHFDTTEGEDLAQLVVDRITPSLERSRGLVHSLIKVASSL